MNHIKGEEFHFSQTYLMDCNIIFGERLRLGLYKVSKKRHHYSVDTVAYSSFCEGNKSHPRCNQDLDDEVSQRECNIRFTLTLIRDM